MTTPAITVPPSLSVAKVARMLLDHGIRALPVVEPDGGALMGIITETDLLMRNAKLHFPSFLGILENVLQIGGDRNLDQELHKVLAVSAGEVMTSDVFTAEATDDLGDVAHEMVQRHLHAVPVVNAGRQVKGMLFPTDVIRLIARDAGD